jgi:hypothetical protein
MASHGVRRRQLGRPPESESTTRAALRTWPRLVPPARPGNRPARLLGSAHRRSRTPIARAIPRGSPPASRLDQWPGS